MFNKTTVFIIGLGNIGFTYDFKLDHKKFILTHASSVFDSKYFNLIAGIDPNLKKRNIFEKKYNVRAFATFEEAINIIGIPKLVIISTPSKLHLQTFCELLKYKIKWVLCEKPMGFSKSDSEKIYDLSRKHKINTYVNYIRRFDPGIKKLKNWIALGRLGSLRHSSIIYTGEMINNASHLLDLVLFLTEKKFKKSNFKISKLNSSNEENFYFVFNNDFYINFINLNTNYEFFEVNLFFSDGLVKLLEGGRKIKIFKKRKDKVFKGYKNLVFENKTFVTDFDFYQKNVLNEIRKDIIRGKKQSLNLSSALIISQLLGKIKEKINV